MKNKPILCTIVITMTLIGLKSLKTKPKNKQQTSNFIYKSIATKPKKQLKIKKINKKQTNDLVKKFANKKIQSFKKITELENLIARDNIIYKINHSEQLKSSRLLDQWTPIFQKLAHLRGKKIKEKLIQLGQKVEFTKRKYQTLNKRKKYEN